MPADGAHWRGHWRSARVVVMVCRRAIFGQISRQLCQKKHGSVAPPCATHTIPLRSRRRDNVSRAVSPTLAGLGEGCLFTLQLLLRYLPPSMTIRFTHGAAAARRGAGQQHGTLTTLVQPLPPIMCALRVKLRGSWS